VPQGKPDVVPTDGLTTRQRRNRPLLIVHTGAMKGKSTAAFGLALRGWHQGWSIGVFQFVKSAKWKVGEEAAFRALDRVHAESGEGGPVEWHKMGEGWSWTRKQGTEDDHAEAAREGWREIARRLAAERHGLYVLDEFTYPMHWGWVDVGEVVAALADRPGMQHVVITGRNAPAELVAAADLVMETTKVKHPMDAGQKGQRGIEW
jgi:cob(I)alamin adenosyltransferase